MAETTQQKIPKVTPERIEAPKLTPEELKARHADIMMLDEMRDERDRRHPELDDMTYLEYYESNRKKDLSYLPPKKNKQDVRISSGLTREKDSTLLSTVLNMNFVPDVTAFDKDSLIVAELGDNMTDHIKKSREIENWQKKRGSVYRELIAQGDVFVQELYVDDFREMPLDEIDWEPGRDKISEFSMRTRLKKIFSGCSVRAVCGKKIYLRSVRKEYIEDQDAVAVLNMYSRDEAYVRYGLWERWENVPTTVDTMGHDWDGTTYKSWNLVPLGNENQVAELIVYNRLRNRVQIYLNGVPMLPHNYPLTAINPSGEIPFAQGKFEPISDFAYSKGQPTKLKIDQEVLDEATKLMIEGMRQGRKPPMGSKRNKVYSKNLFVAGNVTPDMTDGELFSLLQNPGLQQADFNFYQLIKQGIEDKSVNKAYEGSAQQGDPTATQVVQEKEQQMLKLGLIIDGVVNFERRLAWLRIYDILENWTKKYDPDVDSTREGLIGVYRNFSLQTSLEDGQKGIKMFRYTTDKFPDMGEHQREEKALTDEYGQEVRIVYMNPELLRTIKYVWFINVLPTPQSNDHLSQIMFVQNLRNAMELFGPESLNFEYLKQRYAVLTNEDYTKYFRKVDIMQLIEAGYGAEQKQAGGMTDNTGMAGGVQSAAGVRRKPLRAAVK